MKRVLMSLVCLIVIAAPGAVRAESPATSTSSMALDRPPIGEAAGQPIETGDGYVKECPRAKYVDCMPPLAGRAKTLCSVESVRWIKEHCPGVEVVY